MVLPILGMLPAIFSAVSSASELFGRGQKVVKTVTGQPSKASSPEELVAEIQQLPEDQQAKWAEAMQLEISRYEAETERLEVEIGRIDSNITSKLSTETADKIAYLRQTTRPWSVKMAIYFILLPAFLAIIDVVQGLIAYWIVQPLGGLFNSAGMAEFKGFEAFKSVFGVSAFDVATGQSPLGVTAFGSMYTETVGWLTGIVVAYMGLREVGKAMGTSGDTSQRATATAPTSRVGQVLGAAGAMTDQISNIVGKVREAARKF